MKARDAALLELGARQHGAFSRSQAVKLGIPPGTCDRRLQAGHWLDAGQRGVYLLPGHAKTWEQRLAAATLAGPPGTVASHRSAAVLHRLREGTTLEVTVPPGSNHRLGARAHQGDVALGDRTTITGIAATRVERTLVDLAAVVGDDALELALEAAFRLGLTTPERVRERLDGLAVPGRRGIARLRRVLAGRTEGRAAGSDLEVRLIQLLRRAGLRALVRQHEVRIGATRYFLDLAAPDRRLAIEIDGREAHGPAQFQSDRARQNALVLAGWTVLRFTWADVVERPEQVVAAVAVALAA